MPIHFDCIVFSECVSINASTEYNPRRKTRAALKVISPLSSNRVVEVGHHADAVAHCLAVGRPLEVVLVAVAAAVDEALALALLSVVKEPRDGRPARPHGHRQGAQSVGDVAAERGLGPRLLLLSLPLTPNGLGDFPAELLALGRAGKLVKAEVSWSVKSQQQVSLV